MGGGGETLRTPHDSYHLRGTEVYGDHQDDSLPWSVLWAAEEAEEFLFASGNMKYWLVVTREELLGTHYFNSPVTVSASSESCQPYQGKSLGSLKDCNLHMIVL